MASLVMGGTKLSTTHVTAIRPAAAAATMRVGRPIYFYAVGPAKVVTQSLHSNGNEAVDGCKGF